MLVDERKCPDDNMRRNSFIEERENIGDKNIVFF